jgi:5-methylcytosine-specific restriction protein B
MIPLNQIAGRHIVKIAPGPNAERWPECLAEGIIAVGDLRKYPSQNDFLTTFRIHYPANGATTANKLWSLRDLQPGDLIVAKRGLGEVVGVGEVQPPGYEWRPARADYQHTVRVRWDTTAARTIPRQHAWQQTIATVSPELYAEIIGAPPPPPIPRPPDHRVTFDDLLAALAEEGLAYAAETVSNYLLTLQAKRSVIFTRISGT